MKTNNRTSVTNKKSTATEMAEYLNYTGPVPPDIEMYKYQLTLKAEAAHARGDFLEAARCKEENALICRRQGEEENAHSLEHAAYLFRLEYLYQKAEIPIDDFDDVPNADRMQEALTNAADKALKEKDFHYFVAYKRMNARICRARNKERDAFLLEDSAFPYETSAKEMVKKGNISQSEIERICLRYIADKYAGRLYS